MKVRRLHFRVFGGSKPSDSRFPVVLCRAARGLFSGVPRVQLSIVDAMLSVEYETLNVVRCI